MEYVPKHTTENHFLKMVLMVKSWWFVMFVMVFVMETIRNSVMVSIFSAERIVHGLVLVT